MLSRKIRIAIVSLSALVALALPVSALAIEPLQWSKDSFFDDGIQPVGANPASPATRQNSYTLSSDLKEANLNLPNGGSETVRQELVYGNQTFGVDLDWFSPEPVYEYEFQGYRNPGRQWQFVRQPVYHVTARIPATERVALYNTASQRYLVRGDETFGIGLVWSATARYEWQVAEGEPNQTPGGYRTELYNTAEQGYLIEHGRTWGVDLSWVHAPFSIPYGYQSPPPRVPRPQRVGNLGKTAAR
jgi:hypothetical protein